MAPMNKGSSGRAERAPEDHATHRKRTIAMARQDANEAFLQTAFLYGANAGYIEDLYARYQENPSSVDAQWQAFFGALKDDRQAVAKSARGASWKKPNWPIHAN